MGFTQLFKNIFSFYIEGFRTMRVGKTLWAIIGIKVLIFFVIMKWLFFPDYLNENFQTDQERSEYILNNLTQGE